MGLSLQAGVPALLKHNVPFKQAACSPAVAELPACWAAVQLLAGWTSEAAVATCCAGRQVWLLHARAGWRAMGDL